MKINKEKLEILKDLSNLLEKGLITREEFESQKLLLFETENIFENLFQKISLILRLLTPQIVILIAILLFYLPISKIIHNASEVAFGDTFSFKIEKALEIGDSELAKVLNKLTKEEIITLISTVDYIGLYATYTEKNEIVLDDRYDYYISLQQKKLFDSPIDLMKFKKMLESKKASNEDVFVDPVLGSSKRSYYSKSSFSQEELKLLEKVSGELSPLGQKVYWLIVDAAAEQMSTIK